MKRLFWVSLIVFLVCFTTLGLGLNEMADRLSGWDPAVSWEAGRITSFLIFIASTALVIAFVSGVFRLIQAGAHFVASASAISASRLDILVSLAITVVLFQSLAGSLYAAALDLVQTVATEMPAQIVSDAAGPPPACDVYSPASCFSSYVRMITQPLRATAEILLSHQGIENLEAGALIIALAVWALLIWLISSARREDSWWKELGPERKRVGAYLILAIFSSYVGISALLAFALFDQDRGDEAQIRERVNDMATELSANLDRIYAETNRGAPPTPAARPKPRPQGEEAAAALENFSQGLSRRFAEGAERLRNLVAERRRQAEAGEDDARPFFQQRDIAKLEDDALEAEEIPQISEAALLAAGEATLPYIHATAEFEAVTALETAAIARDRDYFQALKARALQEFRGSNRGRISERELSDHEDAILSWFARRSFEARDRLSRCRIHIEEARFYLVGFKAETEAAALRKLLETNETPTVDIEIEEIALDENAPFGEAPPQPEPMSTAAAVSAATSAEDGAPEIYVGLPAPPTISPNYPDGRESEEAFEDTIKEARRVCLKALPFEQSIPQRAGFGSSLGPVATWTSWLLNGESEQVSLIIGLIGFGLLGATASNYFRPHLTGDASSWHEDGATASAYEISSVFVKGFVAAIVVYLTATGGLAIVGNEGSGTPNPYIVFASCLVGAVFSEDVWRRARDRFFGEKPENGAEEAAETPEAPKG